MDHDGGTEAAASKIRFVQRWRDVGLDYVLEKWDLTVKKGMLVTGFQGIYMSERKVRR
jgi:hypothetical protein